MPLLRKQPDAALRTVLLTLRASPYRNLCSSKCIRVAAVAGKDDSYRHSFRIMLKVPRCERFKEPCATRRPCAPNKRRYFRGHRRREVVRHPESGQLRRDECCARAAAKVVACEKAARAEGAKRKLSPCDQKKVPEKRNVGEGGKEPTYQGRPRIDRDDSVAKQPRYYAALIRRLNRARAPTLVGEKKIPGDVQPAAKCYLAPLGSRKSKYVDP